ncbi:glycosyltransferase family 2 protein [Aureimonas sp. OT7]|uniref:glycosyltransferase family 2 protein n=1 Tax=Aureimonas sp. OT7 TaxID=2816454 RepID=UPI001784FD77|nr:glycosyltransferase family 2 protein [Aureimonas sp. OT7]QOG06609.1 glycosyltransferase family 2 protein [Aureimonas sp. OT7]
MRPDVTFIIAAWKAADTLPAALHSALAQQGVDVECVVADDCSGDGTADAARALNDARIKVVSLDRNGGPGAARNAAMRLATGRWLAVLDCDDSVRPDRLARMIARGERLDAAIVVDNIEIAENGRSHPMFPEALLQRTPDISLEAFILSNRMFRSRFNFGYMKPIVRHDFVRQHDIRYPDGLRIGEDFIFLASAMAHGGRCVVEPQAGYVYAVRQGSISRVLHAHHVKALIAADAAFLAGHRLSGPDRAAMAAHRKSLDDAAAFLEVVRHIKDRSIVGALRQGLANPMALAHLRMPIAARLQRLARPAAG